MIDLLVSLLCVSRPFILTGARPCVPVCTYIYTVCVWIDRFAPSTPMSYPYSVSPAPLFLQVLARAAARQTVWGRVAAAKRCNQAEGAEVALVAGQVSTVPLAAYRESNPRSSLFCRGNVPYCTSCATFPLSAKRKRGTTGTVRHFCSTVTLP